MKDGRRINLLGEGRLINLASAKGIRVRDGYELRRPGALLRIHGEEPRVVRKEGLHRSVDLDKRVAKLKLESMGIKIDRLTPEQKSIWRVGMKEPRERCQVLGVRSQGRREPPLMFFVGTGSSTRPTRA